MSLNIKIITVRSLIRNAHISSTIISKVLKLQECRSKPKGVLPLPPKITTHATAPTSHNWLIHKIKRLSSNYSCAVVGVWTWCAFPRVVRSLPLETLRQIFSESWKLSKTGPHTGSASSADQIQLLEADTHILTHTHSQNGGYDKNLFPVVKYTRDTLK